MGSSIKDLCSYRFAIRNGTLIKTLNEPIYDEFNPINSLSFSPDGQTFVSCDRYGTIKLWKRDGTLIETLIENSRDSVVGSSLRGVKFSPDGQMIAAGTMFGTINLWQLDCINLPQSTTK